MTASERPAPATVGDRTNHADTGQPGEAVREGVIGDSLRPSEPSPKGSAPPQDGTKGGGGGPGDSAGAMEPDTQESELTQDETKSGSAVPGDSADGTQSGGKKTFFVILTADSAGRKQDPLQSETGPPPLQDPSAPSARQIAFHLRRGLAAPPPSEQMEWHRAAERLIRALNHLYPPDDPESESKFRLYYVSVFQLARLTLEDGILDIKAAREELATIEQSLIADAGPGVKNGHILDLLRWAAALSLPFLLAYVFLCHAPNYMRVYQFLHTIHVRPEVLANFMLLWIGCFLGVCLSYALRKHDFTVDDLITAEADLLRPAIRLAFAGTLAMLLVMFSVWGILDVQVGHTSLSSVADPREPMFAFFVGTVCGISEMLLPGKVSSAAVLTFK